MAVASMSSQDPSADLLLAPFLSETFSPADYLNSTLPSWTPNLQSTITSTSTSTFPSTSLAEVTAQTQTTIAQLNVQLTRLSATLTSMADDILRAGGRLAYEVELLRGDTGGLCDTLAERLSDRIVRFAPRQTAQDDTIINETASESLTNRAATRLHTLKLVRDRLDDVIKVFGEAMEWPVAPSEVFSKSPFISMSGPDDGVDLNTREKQGKACHDKLRAEISEMVSTGSDAGELAALRRLEALRVLAAVWKGTSEEKPRLKIIDSLAKIVEDSKLASSTTSKIGYGLGTHLPSRSRLAGK